jgi:hypothetical protein
MSRMRVGHQFPLCVENTLGEYQVVTSLAFGPDVGRAVRPVLPIAPSGLSNPTCSIARRRFRHPESFLPVGKRKGAHLLPFLGHGGTLVK